MAGHIVCSHHGYFSGTPPAHPGVGTQRTQTESTAAQANVAFVSKAAKNRAGRRHHRSAELNKLRAKPRFRLELTSALAAGVPPAWIPCQRRCVAGRFIQCRQNQLAPCTAAVKACGLGLDTALPV